MIENLESYYKRNVDNIRQNYKYKEFKYKYGSSFPRGGKLICTHCGKEYTLKDWGRGKTRALTSAMKHLTDKHNLTYFTFSPYALRDTEIFYSAYPEAK